MSRTFEVTAPDGKRYRIAAPDNATREQVLQRAHTYANQQRIIADRKRLTAGQTAGAFVGDVVDNILPNWADELYAVCDDSYVGRLTTNEMAGS